MATQLDEFSEMINSIQFLHMSKNQDLTTTHDSGGSANNSQHQNHQQQLETASNVLNDINSDVIFFYEENDNNNGSASANCNESVEMEVNNSYAQDGSKNSINNSDFSNAIADTACNSFSDYLLESREEVPQLKQIKVNVGIDEDLKMILEMDPSIVNLDDDDNNSDDPIILGLPPISGG